MEQLRKFVNELDEKTINDILTTDQKLFKCMSRRSQFCLFSLVNFQTIAKIYNDRRKKVNYRSLTQIYKIRGLLYIVVIKMGLPK